MNVHRYYLTSSANIALIQSWSIKQLVATNKRARAVVRVRFSFVAHPNFSTRNLICRSRYRIINASFNPSGKKRSSFAFTAQTKGIRLVVRHNFPRRLSQLAKNPVIFHHPLKTFGENYETLSVEGARQKYIRRTTWRERKKERMDERLLEGFGKDERAKPKAKQANQE